MARNKYPEITVEKILDVSQRLFLEKGYDKTTIQDIVDELGGLSKGAIYHHFKSEYDKSESWQIYDTSQNNQVIKDAEPDGANIDTSALNEEWGSGCIEFCQ